MDVNRKLLVGGCIVGSKCQRAMRGLLVDVTGIKVPFFFMGGGEKLMTDCGKLTGQTLSFR